MTSCKPFLRLVNTNLLACIKINDALENVSQRAEEDLKYVST